MTSLVFKIFSPCGKRAYMYRTASWGLRELLALDKGQRLDALLHLLLRQGVEVICEWPRTPQARHLLLHTPAFVRRQ